MARTDAVVLGAGIVGTSIALHLVKRGLAVVLLDRGAPGQETSYGNAGLIEADTLFPPAFPADWGGLLRIALKQAPEVNYHPAYLPQMARWLLAFRAASRPGRLEDTARIMRPLMAQAVAEHEGLMAEADALPLLRKNGWLKLYRSDDSFRATARERALADEFGLDYAVLEVEQALGLEPSLAPVFRRAVHWRGAASVSDPLGLTRAYAARFGALGGLLLKGDARSLHRSGNRWRVDTDEGPVDAKDAVVALGPWSPDLLEPLGLRLPLAAKRGYHRHFAAKGNATLTRPLLDADGGYCLAPMAQGLRITTGVEIAPRDAPPTPVQLDRLMPAARALFPLGEPVEAAPWLGARPSFPDSRPVIGPAPGHDGLWLAIGHAHWGLTLGPITGQMIAAMITGEPSRYDAAPFAAGRFLDD